MIRIQDTAHHLFSLPCNNNLDIYVSDVQLKTSPRMPKKFEALKMVIGEVRKVFAFRATQKRML